MLLDICCIRLRADCKGDDRQSLGLSTLISTSIAAPKFRIGWQRKRSSDDVAVELQLLRDDCGHLLSNAKLVLRTREQMLVVLGRSYYSISVIDKILSVRDYMGRSVVSPNFDQSCYVLIFGRNGCDGSKIASGSEIEPNELHFPRSK